MGFDQQTFRTHLQATLLQHHLSLREAARKSGVSASTLSRLVNGETPDMETFALLIKWLECDPNIFFNHEWNVLTDAAPAWAMLYTSLEVLGASPDLIEAIVKIIQVIQK